MEYKIIVDENIPYAKEAFSTLGNVRLLSGKDITNDALKNTDILCVRSVTKVDETLLKGTKVSFVATATIGFDHIDTEYLKANNIEFSSAPGSNANSVAEYVISAILEVSKRKEVDFRAKSIGIIGVGNVGSIVYEKVQALGIAPVLNDPFLRDETKDDRYRPLIDLYDCDIISLHTPLTHEGKYPTYHLADDMFFSKLRNCELFINTSRGAVVDEDALHKYYKDGRIKNVCLDVFKNEPNISYDAADYTLITPHIAGYSYDGKLHGTKMIYEAACAFLNEYPTWSVANAFEEDETSEKEIRIYNEDMEAYDVFREAVFSSYAISNDDEALKAAFKGDDVASSFHSLRKNYSKRREFDNTTVLLEKKDDVLNDSLNLLGFKTLDNE